MFSINCVNGTLLINIPGNLTDDLSDKFKSAVTQQLLEEQSEGVVMDVSEMAAIDSYQTKFLSDIAQSIKLMGSQPVLVGIRPEVAISLVNLGQFLGDVETAVTIEHAFEIIRSKGADSHDNN